MSSALKVGGAVLGAAAAAGGGGGGGGGGAQTSAPITPITPIAPTTPVLSLGAGVVGGATSAEALAAEGVVTVSGEAGSSIVVTFTDSSLHTVSKTVTGTGSGQAVTLSASDLGAGVSQLGNGAVTVSAVATDSAGNASSAGTISFTLDTVAPTVSSVALTSATGSSGGYLNSGDVLHATVTLGEAVTVTGTPNLSLNVGGTSVTASYDSGLSSSTSLVFDYTIQAGQTDANGISMDANSLSLNGGTITDAAGNSATLTHSAVTDNAAYMVDAVAPTFSSAATGGIADSGLGITTVYTASASDAGSNGITYALSAGADVNLFSIDSTTGVVSFKTTETYLATHDAGADHVYDITLSATDAAGNASTQAVALTMTSPIVVYYDAAHTQSAGNLIAPVMVDGGNSFYYWNISGDDRGYGTLDMVTHDFIDGIFNKDVNGVMNPSGPTADTTDTYRYGTLYTSNGTAVKVALPTLGAAYVEGFATDAAVNAVNEVNSTYNDLLAIWAAFHAAPAGWNSILYWSATQAINDHAGIIINMGYVFKGYESDKVNVAVQVL